MSPGNVARLSLALVTAAALALAGCAGGGTAVGGARPGTTARDTLTVGLPAAPNSLDPAKANAAFSTYLTPAYDPLIKRRPDGSLAPALATSWRYLGTATRASS